MTADASKRAPQYAPPKPVHREILGKLEELGASTLYELTVQLGLTTIEAHRALFFLKEGGWVDVSRQKDETGFEVARWYSLPVEHDPAKTARDSTQILPFTPGSTRNISESKLNAC